MTTTPPKASALSDLVAARMDELSLSFGDVAVRTGISKAGVHKIARNKLVRVPEAATITALARALQLPEQDLIAAAARDIGLIQETLLSEPDELAIAFTKAKLTEADRAYLLDYLHTVRGRINSA